MILFYYGIVISMEKCKFLQGKKKNSVEGVYRHDKISNMHSFEYMLPLI